jgi:hypothetical protein
MKYMKKIRVINKPKNNLGWTDAQMIKAYNDGVNAGMSNATRQYGDGWEISNGKDYIKNKRKKK